MFVSRANWGEKAMPMATTTETAPGRKIAVIASATMIGG